MSESEKIGPPVARTAVGPPALVALNAVVSGPNCHDRASKVGCSTPAGTTAVDRSNGSVGGKDSDAFIDELALKNVHVPVYLDDGDNGSVSGNCVESRKVRVPSNDFDPHRWTPPACDASKVVESLHFTDFASAAVRAKATLSCIGGVSAVNFPVGPNDAVPRRTRLSGARWDDANVFVLRGGDVVANGGDDEKRSGVGSGVDKTVGYGVTDGDFVRVPVGDREIVGDCVPMDVWDWLLVRVGLWDFVTDGDGLRAYEPDRVRDR